MRFETCFISSEDADFDSELAEPSVNLSLLSCRESAVSRLADSSDRRLSGMSSSLLSSLSSLSLLDEELDESSLSSELLESVSSSDFKLCREEELVDSWTNIEEEKNKHIGL